LFTIEFNRDWNLNQPLGNQSLLTTGLDVNFEKNGFAKYQLEKLDFSENFNGTRHLFLTQLKHKKTTFSTDFSAMNSDGTLANSTFIRNQSMVRQHIDKNWIGGTFRHENNQETLVETNQL